MNTLLLNVNGDYRGLSNRRGLLLYPLMFLLGCLSFVLPDRVHAQDYDLLIKNGHVIDPANEIDGVRDVARVASNISEASAERVVDA